MGRRKRLREKASKIKESVAGTVSGAKDRVKERVEARRRKRREREATVDGQKALPSGREREDGPAAAADDLDLEQVRREARVEAVQEARQEFKEEFRDDFREEVKQREKERLRDEMDPKQTADKEVSERRQSTQDESGFLAAAKDALAEVAEAADEIDDDPDARQPQSESQQPSVFEEIRQAQEEGNGGAAGGLFGGEVEGGGFPQPNEVEQDPLFGDSDEGRNDRDGGLFGGL